MPCTGKSLCTWSDAEGMTHVDVTGSVPVTNCCRCGCNVHKMVSSGGGISH